MTISAGALLAAVLVTSPAHAAPDDILGEVPAPSGSAAEVADVAPLPDVRELHVSRPAISPDDDGAADQLAVSFELPPASAAASARVVDERGSTVKLLGQFVPGDDRVVTSWNGAGKDGKPVADGRYRIVVAPALPDAAVALAAAPDTTDDAVAISPVVRVDRRAPTVRILQSSIRVLSRAARTIAVPILSSEAATIRIASRSSVGTSRRVARRTGGRSIVRIPVRGQGALSRAFDRGGRAKVSMRVAVFDTAGNRAFRKLAIDVLPPASEQLSWPMHAAVTSGFGPRWGRLHAGIDMPVPEGTPIHAAGPGRVVSASYDGGYGNSVVIDHGPHETRYAHQSRLLVHAGQRVERGQVIGYSGNTGSSTGAHLHFEVHVDGVPQDPLAYLP